MCVLLSGHARSCLPTHLEKTDPGQTGRTVLAGARVELLELVWVEDKGLKWSSLLACLTLNGLK